MSKDKKGKPGSEVSSGRMGIFQYPQARELLPIALRRKIESFNLGQQAKSQNPTVLARYSLQGGSNWTWYMTEGWYLMRGKGQGIQSWVQPTFSQGLLNYARMVSEADEENVMDFIFWTYALGMDFEGGNANLWQLMNWKPGVVHLDLSFPDGLLLSDALLRDGHRELGETIQRQARKS